MPIWGMALSAFGEIRHNRIRAVLSVICVAIGVLAVTLMVAAAAGTQEANRREFEMNAGRPGVLEIMINSNKGPPRMADDLVGQIRADLQRYRIVGTPVRRASNVSYRYGTKVITPQGMVETIGADPALSEIRRLPLVSGRWLSPTDRWRLEPSLVVSKGFARRLGIPPETAVGTQIEIAASGLWMHARIVGLIDLGRDDRGDNDGRPSEAYLPYSAMDALNLGEDMTSFMIRVPQSQTRQVTQRLRAESKRSWGLSEAAEIHPLGPDFSQLGGALSKVMLAVAVLILGLGGLPVLALGLTSIKHRRSELGIQRCFGATGPDLFLTVLLESLIVSLAGGLVGIGLGFAGHGPSMGVLLSRGPFAAAAGDTAVSFPWQAALLGLGSAVCVGLFTGLIPALRAMQRSVIRAIRS